MAVAKSYTAQLIGLQADIVTVEVDIANGLNTFSIVGLGDRSVSEAKDRISAAIKNSGYVSPKQKNQKVVISLAPADTRKEGSAFDLAMAVAYLCAAGDIDFKSENILFLGELSLEGNIRKISGLLPMLCQAPGRGFTSAFVPQENVHEASLARGIPIYPVSSLKETLEIITGVKNVSPLEPVSFEAAQANRQDTANSSSKWMDMSVIRGNEACKRALEIAAAGAHNLLMRGPPGTGKTMLAQSFCSILPPLSYEQAVEVTGIHSAARTLHGELIIYPPFRSPHHTASYPAIIGGGSFPHPGEVTLAHRGVLFMDEFPEFDRSVIDAMRQPLEEHSITISRAKGVVTFPAQCILLASMNPCPCGKGRDNGCLCPEHIVASYRRRISGPILDRIDIWMAVNKVDYEKIAARTSVSEYSAVIRSRVTIARERQLTRFRAHGIDKTYNSEMNAKDIEKCIVMQEDARSLLKISAERFELSGRAFHRIIKVAQTIADIAGKKDIGNEEILEALQYREKNG